MDMRPVSSQEEQQTCSKAENEKSRAEAWTAWKKERDEAVILEEDGITVTLAMVWAGAEIIPAYSRREHDFDDYARCYIEMEKQRRLQSGH